jgi:uncharacterized tellurite resistance protein B-like protein
MTRNETSIWWGDCTAALKQLTAEQQRTALLWILLELALRAAERTPLTKQNVVRQAELLLEASRAP